MRSCGRGETAVSHPLNPKTINLRCLVRRLDTTVARTAARRWLSSHQPHGPACQENSAHEHGKTIQAVADHVAGGFAMGNAEDDGAKQREHKSRTEVGEGDDHCFFPIAMW